MTLSSLSETTLKTEELDQLVILWGGITGQRSQSKAVTDRVRRSASTQRSITMANMEDGERQRDHQII